jgi:hypothetical protein
MITPASRERGVSLVEALVATAIMAIVIVAALTMYERGSTTFKRGLEAANMQQSTRVPFEKVVADLRMTGFDFDRDGTPSSAGQYQQPDEQIEFIGESAITIRGNFDYDAESAPCTATLTDDCDNGREKAYESTEFPVVTTGNDEIVTFALVSDNPAKNTDSIQFYADTAVPRNAHPGGSAETLVRIPGVDFSNANPPYTLERITLAEDGSLIRVPVAKDVRSIKFQYYEDATGTKQLTDLATTPATIAAGSYATAVGGLGAYDPATPETISEVHRLIRSKVQSIRVSLVGMSEQPDAVTVDPTDTIAPRYRKYRLDSLVVARNYGRRGAKEQEYKAPGPPRIKRACYGYCGVVYIEWDAPISSSSTGAPDQYAILYDTSTSTGFSNIHYTGNVLYGYVTLPDPSASYYFAVEAINSYGASVSSPVGPFSVANATKPNAPSGLTATPVTGGSAITLSWQAPTSVASGGITCVSGSAPSDLPTTEIKGWRVYRKSEFETTWPTTPIIDETTSIGAPNWNILTGQVTFTDTTVANCVNYSYRVVTVERCTLNSQNTTNNGTDGLSDPSNIATGRADSTTKPAAPGTPSITGTTVGANYQMTLSWPAVQQDTATPPKSINVAKYVIHRTQRKVGVAAATYSVPTTITVDPLTATFTPSNYPSTITWVDTQPTTAGDGIGFYYEYQVAAVQCLSPESDLSTLVRYPCNFNGGTVTMGISPASAIVEGSGTSVSPWLIQPTANLVVTTTVGIQRIEATITIGSGSATPLGTQTTPANNVTSASFAIPSLGSSTGMISVTLLDTNGCTKSGTFYVSEVANNCCLMPVSVDSNMRFVDSASRTVFYRFKNVCGEALTVSRVIVNWDSNYTNGNPNIDVYLPASLGQGPPPATSPSVQVVTNNTSGSVTAPTGAATTTVPLDGAATTDDYWMRIIFSRGTISSSAPPITSICVVYRRSGIDTSDRICRIEPSPSPTPDTCP